MALIDSMIGDAQNACQRNPENLSYMQLLVSESLTKCVSDLQEDLLLLGNFLEGGSHPEGEIPGA